MIRAYFEMLLAETEATQGLPRDARIGDAAGKMKQFATWFTHGVPGGAKLRKSIYQAKTGGEVLDRVNEFFREEPTLPLGVEDEIATDAFPDAALVCD
jgi:tRNA-dihydrouridine synthase B